MVADITGELLGEVVGPASTAAGTAVMGVAIDHLLMRESQQLVLCNRPLRFELSDVTEHPTRSAASLIDDGSASIG